MQSFNPSTDNANLLPVHPSTVMDSRYPGAVRLRVSPTILPLGTNLVSAPSYQSQRWTVSAHPEGKRYAHIKSESGITVVTEANIADPGVSDQLNAWLAFIYNTAIAKDVQIPETSHLFLDVHQDSGTCNYYFADHGLRTIFWLHTLNTISVGVPPSNSGSYLQHSLEENYWIHVELFPGTASQYSAKAQDELQVVFAHARADVPTSEAHTFPYTAKECGEFVDLLERCKDHVSNPFVVTYVARLCETVANPRSFIDSGHEKSFNQSALEVPDGKCSFVLAIISKTLLFDLPDRYEARFKSFWVDQLVDASRWREHASEVVGDLKQTMSWILALLGASTLTSSSSGLIKASLFLCAFNLIVTSFLLQRQKRLLSKKIPTSVEYLKHWNTCFGFQPIAIVHSLPQALFVWALLLFSMQSLWVVFSDLSLPLRLSMLLLGAIILVMMSLGIWLIVHPRAEPIDSEDAMLPPAIPSSKLTEEQTERTIVESMV